MTAGRHERVDEVLAAAYEAGAIEDADGRRREVVPDGIAPGQGAALRDLVAAEGAGQTIEVGFALGLSALHICSGLLRGVANPRHVAIDHTETYRWANAGTLLVERAGVADMVELHESSSQVVLPKLFEQGRRFDFAFVDGDHRFDGVLVDLYFLVHIVEPGGLILVDDVWMPAVRLAVAYFETNLGLELLPDAIPGAFRWARRRPFSRAVRSGSGETAVLRMPPDPIERPWDHFVPDFRF